MILGYPYFRKPPPVSFPKAGMVQGRSRYLARTTTSLEHMSRRTDRPCLKSEWLGVSSTRTCDFLICPICFDLLIFAVSSVLICPDTFLMIPFCLYVLTVFVFSYDLIVSDIFSDSGWYVLWFYHVFWYVRSAILRYFLILFAIWSYYLYIYISTDGIFSIK